MCGTREGDRGHSVNIKWELHEALAYTMKKDKSAKSDLPIRARTFKLFSVPKVHARHPGQRSRPPCRRTFKAVVAGDRERYRQASLSGQ